MISCIEKLRKFIERERGGQWLPLHLEGGEKATIAGALERLGDQR